MNDPCSTTLCFVDVDVDVELAFLPFFSIFFSPFVEFDGGIKPTTPFSLVRFLVSSRVSVEVPKFTCVKILISSDLIQLKSIGQDKIRTYVSGWSYLVIFFAYYVSIYLSACLLT